MNSNLDDNDNDNGSRYGSARWGSSSQNADSGDALSPDEQQVPQKSAFPVVSLLVSLLCLLLALIPLLGMVFSTAALFLAVIAGIRAFKKGRGNKTVAALAIIFAFIGDIAAAGTTIAGFMLFSAADGQAKNMGFDLVQMAKDVITLVREPDTQPSDELRARLTASLEAAGVKYRTVTGKEPPYTQAEVKALADNGSIIAMNQALLVADEINAGQLSPEELEQKMQLLDVKFHGGAIGFHKEYSSHGSTQLNWSDEEGLKGTHTMSSTTGPAEITVRPGAAGEDSAGQVVGDLDGKKE